MKKYYNTPATNAQQICQLNAICVGSVHSEEDIHLGGGSNGSDPNQLPF